MTPEPAPATGPTTTPTLDGPVATAVPTPARRAPVDVRGPVDDGRAVAPAPVPPAPAAPPVPPGRRETVRDVVLLGSMAALPALATDMYLPSLPDVARDLSTSAAAAQITMTGMLVGGAIGQLVMGPVSDRFGRRRPVLAGVAGHVLASLLCVVAPSIVTLIGLRVSQGFLAAAATVGAMAVIRDRYVGSLASQMMSRLMLVIGVAPLFAPSIGGAIADRFGWRAVFAALALLGVALWVFVRLALRESLPPALRRTGGVRTALHGYRAVLRDRTFLGFAVLPGLGMAVLFSYVISSPFVLREQFGMSAQGFSLVFALNGVGLVLGAQVNAALVTRVGPLAILRVAPVLTLGLTATLLVLALTGAGLVPMLVVLWFVLAAVNFTPPNASALALQRHGAVAGTAAAVLGALQAGVAGVVSPITGLLGGDAVAMASVMTAAALCGVAVFLVMMLRARRRGVDGRSPALGR